MNKAIVVANGTLEMGVAVELVLAVAAEAYVIGADGGAMIARDLGLMPHLVIGDFDSISPADLEAFAEQGITTQRYPAAKDETDLELALLAAVERGATWIRILAALGNRLDQSLANIYLLSLPQLKGRDVRLVAGKQTAWLAEAGQHYLSGQVGDTISLLPFGGPCHHIRTHDLAYPLADESLTLGPARGISNVITGPHPMVEFTDGVLLVVHTVGRA
ncbi:MAG: thiamine diphosphokinase [Anaerolineales bacterium]|nr:thiamine diphosphokinase [Anaerolineales bacterium]